MQVRRYGITKSVGGADYCVEDGDGVASAAWLVRSTYMPAWASRAGCLPLGSIRIAVASCAGRPLPLPRSTAMSYCPATCR